MEKYLIILDSFEYKSREAEFCDYISDVCDPTFFYSKYENGLTEIFMRTKYVGGLLTHITYWIISLGYAFRILIGKYRKYDNIVFINPIVGIFYAALMRSLFVNKNISICGFLFENKKNKLYLMLRKAFVIFCYKSVNKICVYGENEVKHYENIFPELKGKFQYVKYGRDFHYKDKKDLCYEDAYIASGGRSNRCYETLCKAMQILKGRGITENCLVATRPECVTANMEKSPVKFQYGITLNQFGSFIKHSCLFVLPLLNTKISAGHMVMMEAMANGKPIVVTDIPAIRDYVNNSQVIFYNADDAEDMANKIQNALQKIGTPEINDMVERSKALYENEYSFKALLKRIVSNNKQLRV